MRPFSIPVPILALLAIAGCGPKAPTEPKTDAPVYAVLEPKSGSVTKGMAEFFPTSDGKVKVKLEIRGAKPGKHGVHIHEKGDCSAADAASAGPHFNPTNSAHGGPSSSPRHAGDLGNAIVSDAGTGSYSTVVEGITLDQGPAGIVGRAIVFHDQEDDLTGQPAGNAGARVACGVLKAK